MTPTPPDGPHVSPPDLPAAPRFEGLVHLPDVRLFVRQFGDHGPELVVVHGGPDWDHTYFLPYLLPLAAHLRLTLFDLRGCGRSQRFGEPRRCGLDRAVDDLAHLLAHLGLRGAALLGFSFGGRVVLRFADRYPQLAGQLILASTTAYEDFRPELDAWDAYQQRNDAAMRAKLAAILAAPDLSDEERTRRMALLTCPLDVADLARLPELRAVLARVAFSGEWMAALRAGLLGGVRHADYGERLAALGLPVLLLHGEQDMRFPVSVARRLHARLPRSELVVLPGVGHLAHIEATDAWNAAVLRFMMQGSAAAPERR